MSTIKWSSILMASAFMLGILNPQEGEARRKSHSVKKTHSKAFIKPAKLDFSDERYGKLESLEEDDTDYSKSYTSNWQLGKADRINMRRKLYKISKQTCRDQYPTREKKSKVSWKKLGINEAASTKSELGCDYTQDDCVAKACVIASDEFEVDPYLLFCVLRRETFQGTMFHPKASQGGGNGLAQFTPPAFNEVMNHLFNSKGGPREDSDTYRSFINYYQSINETRLNLATGSANFDFYSDPNDTSKKMPYVNFCDPVQSIGAAAAYLSMLGADSNMTAAQSAKIARKYNGNPKGGIKWAYGKFVNKCSNASKTNREYNRLIQSNIDLNSPEAQDLWQLVEKNRMNVKNGFR